MQVQLIAVTASKKGLSTLSHYKKMEVELEGIEPSSKQGNHTLSTCLSWPSLSGCDKTQATNHSLIP